MPAARPALPAPLPVATSSAEQAARSHLVLKAAAPLPLPRRRRRLLSPSPDGPFPPPLPGSGARIYTCDCYVSLVKLGNYIYLIICELNEPNNVNYISLIMFDQWALLTCSVMNSVLY